MTVEEIGLYMKVTPAMVYNLIKKGKLKTSGVSTIDKPGARPVEPPSHCCLFVSAFYDG
jgi:hypothetical protein